MLNGLMLLEASRHFINLRRKYRPKNSNYKPSVALISPCKGLDNTFDRNIKSLLEMDYPNYQVCFVVQSDEDPAYHRLLEIIKAQNTDESKIKTSITIAGTAKDSGQKVHNLLSVVNKLGDDIEVLAFVDSDACPRKNHLSALVHPLRRHEQFGASTGYRWFVPTDNRLASKVLSAMNAFFAAILGPHGRNSAWGGSMAIRRDTFEKIELATLWQGALSDDYSLTYAVRKAGLTIAYAPACLVGSYEQTNWSDLFSFARRQFIITWCCMRQLWFMAATGFLQHLVSFWLGVCVSLYAAINNDPHLKYIILLPIICYSSTIIRGLLRQSMIRKILPRDKNALLAPALIDIFCQPVLSIFTFICILTAFGKDTICWRGIKYKIVSISKTQILP